MQPWRYAPQHLPRLLELLCRASTLQCGLLRHQPLLGFDKRGRRLRGLRQIPRAGPHEVHWWQLNLLQELRNFVRFCGMGGRLSIHPRPAFSVEGQVGMSTSICSPGWGTGCSRAATSTSYKNLGKFDRARLDMASTGSPSTHVQGPSLRPSGRLTNTLDSDSPHVAIFGNLCTTASMAGRQGTGTTRSSFSTISSSARGT